MDKLSRLISLKDKGTVCIKTVAGKFIGVVVSVSPIEIEIEQIGCQRRHLRAYISTDEVRMIVVNLEKTP